MERVVIIGLGLIGGSIALAIKRAHRSAVTVIGNDVRQEELELAKTLHVIDEASLLLQDACEQADYIFIATPVQQTEKMIEQLATFRLKETCIVTDVGSTKQRIVETAERLLGERTTFIGGHPMAGSHKSGVQAAVAHLFENAYYIMTPTRYATDEAVDRLTYLLRGTKAKFIRQSAAEHDEVVGVISHFPHIIAASLVHQARLNEEENPLTSQLAAGGFRDITRIASSNPTMWRDILLHNKKALLQLFDRWKEEMTYIEHLIKRNDAYSIYRYFEDAKDYRDGLPTKEKGAIPSFYDLYVDVPDYPGVISEVTGYLAEERISITNIQIIESREDILGVLRLSFQTVEERERAKRCLTERASYRSYEG